MTRKSYMLWVSVNRIHDGDTLYGSIDQGLGLWNLGPNDAGWGFRLDGCNAIELPTAGGRAARDNLATLIPVGSVLQVESVRWDKFSGRLDVKIDHPLYGDLTDHLIAEGWAVRWDGRGARPVPPWPRVA